MIEKAVVNYLNNHPTLVAYKNKFYYHRVPTNAVMPWCYIVSAGGSREKIAPYRKEPFDTIQLYVESQKQFEGYDLAQSINTLLDGYRGNMGDVKDLLINCDTVRDLDGFFQSYRYMLTVHVKYIIQIESNNH